jgi:hypothetical protein
VTILLIVLAVLAAYALFVLASPVTACRTCRGYGMKPRRWRRRATCHRCGGTGFRFRPGARLVHRAAAARMRARMTGTPLPRPPLRPPRGHPEDTQPEAIRGTRPRSPKED